MDPRQDPATGRWMSPTEIEQKEEILVLQNLLRNSQNELKQSQILLRNTIKELQMSNSSVKILGKELAEHKKWLDALGIKIPPMIWNKPEDSGVIVSVEEKLRELEDRISKLEDKTLDN